MDTKQKKSRKQKMDPLNYKAYRYCDSFNPVAISTCPIVPKHHRTFGEPSTTESVSEQIERESR